VSSELYLVDVSAATRRSSWERASLSVCL
jgi:hypothetical protein